MKAKRPNAELVCKQFEDALAPRLRLSTTDRAVYYHLLRHSRFEGKFRLHFSIIWLARNLGLTEETVRASLRRLVQHRALRLVQRSKAGHVMDVRLPEEVPGARLSRAHTRVAVPSPNSGNLEEIDFMRTPELRQAIHAREGGVCFYCLRCIGPQMQCLDHVIPRAQRGPNSYRNLVSCCLECNSRKGERPAADFLRSLYREGRLTGVELIGGLQSLNDLAAGKLRPPLQHPDVPLGIPAHHTKPVIPSGAGRLFSSAFAPRTRRPAQSRNLSASSTALCSTSFIGRKGRPRLS